MDCAEVMCKFYKKHSDGFCEDHKICPSCNINERSTDSYDMKEYGWCSACIDLEQARIDEADRKAYDYVFGPPDTDYYERGPLI